MALLDVVLSYDCNLACTYCTISMEMRRRALPSSRVAREIDRAAQKGYRDVAFTGGEPTIYPDLPGLVRYAKKRGFEHVKVASNGLRYAHAAYLDHLVESGVDRFNISVHARSDVEYDLVVRREGAAALRNTAIQNLVSRGLDPVADLIMKTDTINELRPWVADLRALGVRRFALWLVSLTDANAPNVEQLPRMSELAPQMTAVFDLARLEGFEAVSLHVPRCLLRGYENHVAHPGADAVTVVTPDSVFELKDSRLAGGIKPEPCSRCQYRDVCPGLRPDYVARHGVLEVAPFVREGAGES